VEVRVEREGEGEGEGEAEVLSASGVASKTMHSAAVARHAGAIQPSARAWGITLRLRRVSRALLADSERWWSYS
jgi:hypothetical protein